MPYQEYIRGGRESVVLCIAVCKHPLPSTEVNVSLVPRPSLYLPAFNVARGPGDEARSMWSPLHKGYHKPVQVYDHPALICIIAHYVR